MSDADFLGRRLIGTYIQRYLNYSTSQAINAAFLLFPAVLLSFVFQFVSAVSLCLFLVWVAPSGGGPTIAFKHEFGDAIMGQDINA